jgi:dihydroorotase
MTDWLITNAELVNEGRRETGDVHIRDGRIEKIGKALTAPSSAKLLDAKGRWLLPGMIDDQVHFREPGLTQKADIESESRACVAGGITSYMEMPNTRPPATDHAALEWKYTRASEVSRVNYAFYFGATNDNLEAIRTLDKLATPGIKVFMGASTGNMLVDDPAVLDAIFAETPVPIITHCEDTPTILANELKARERWGDDIPADQHPLIRSREACVMSTKLAISLAKKHGTRLHVLHISTADECALFEPGPVAGKKITAETCVHFLHFTDADYARLGHLIKCNPAIKTAADRDGITRALAERRIDVLATDHAPHLASEKAEPYVRAPSGLPLVQYALQCAIERVLDGKLTLERVVEAVSHAPATLFNVRERGFIREGYFADLVLVDPAKPHAVTAADVLSKCGWSPFEGYTFRSSIAATFVNGHLAWNDGQLDDSVRGKRLEFAR